MAAGESQEIHWRAHPTVAEIAVLNGCEAEWWGTSYGRARWAVFLPGGEQPARHGAADSPAQAKEQAETALREVASRW